MSKQQTVNDLINQFVATEQLPASFMPMAVEYFVPASKFIAGRLMALREGGGSQTLVVGVNGAQGTGKSTFSELLRRLLQAQQLACVVISIDDLYLTREQRSQLAIDVHPLLQTRGVPGTHDLVLGLQLLAELKRATGHSRTVIPRFDKARDDRYPTQHWQVHEGPVDVIVLEGWCVGAQPVCMSGEPLNQLEQEHDASGVWRAFIEARLWDYQQLFSQMDLLVMLKAPSIESIIEWRMLQEQKLSQKVSAAAQKGTMGKHELLRFIMHYERLTRIMLDTVPGMADIVFTLNDSHEITGARYRKHDKAGT